MLLIACKSTYYSRYPVSGFIYDKETKKPIENVLICTTNNDGKIFMVEVSTNSRGYFEVPPIYHNYFAKGQPKVGFNFFLIKENYCPQNIIFIDSKPTTSYYKLRNDTVIFESIYLENNIDSCDINLKSTKIEYK